ncbi:hypothetical protein, partial [Thiolapillus sp.]
KTFYERLYSDRQVEECEISDLVGDIPTLTLQEKTSLEGKITLDEASAALKNMKNNKSPGSDGFTVEFFKFFWLQLGAFIVNSLNDGFRKGELSSTQKEGVIICIPKGNKDKQLLKKLETNLTSKCCVQNRISMYCQSFKSCPSYFD